MKVEAFPDPHQPAAVHQELGDGLGGGTAEPELRERFVEGGRRDARGPELGLEPVGGGLLLGRQPDFVARQPHLVLLDDEHSGAGEPVETIFTPHLVPMDRGILTTAYSVPRERMGEDKLLDHMRDFYADMPFVRVVSHLPATKDTAHTNFCDVTVRVVRGRVITISCIDNLIKGASGAAVQNFNLMYGFPQTMAL